MTESYNFGEMMRASRDAFKPVGKGDHVGVIEKCDATKSSSGKSMWKTVVRVASGPDAGRSFFNNITLTPPTENDKATAMFFVQMAAIGLDEAFFMTPGLTAEQIAAAMVGKAALYTIDHREWGGVLRENVTKIQKVSGYSGMPGVTTGISGIPATSGTPGGPPIPVAPTPAPVPATSPPVPPAPAVPVPPAPAVPVPPVPPTPPAPPVSPTAPVPPAPTPAPANSPPPLPF